MATLSEVVAFFLVLQGTHREYCQILLKVFLVGFMIFSYLILEKMYWAFHSLC